MRNDPAALVDLDRYPIQDLDDLRTRALGAKCRAALDATGVAILPGFVFPTAIAAIVAEAEHLGADGHHQDLFGSPYLDSLHRVTPVEGTTDRLVALLGYDTQPGTCSSEILRLVRYGRAEARR